MKTTLKFFSIYGIAYFIMLAIVLGLLYAFPKEELHLLVNSHHMPLEDIFFKYYSLLAEWPLYVLALLPAFWRHIQMTLLFAMSELTGGAVLQILKHLFCFERPVSVFEHHSEVLPLVQGVDMYHSNSFPSGHASTFFVFFTCCALILAYHYRQSNNQLSVRKKSMICMTMLALLTMAVLGAYSRVYLSQHFMSDICVGSIIGFTSPCLMFFFARNKILKLGNRLNRTLS